MFYFRKKKSASKLKVSDDNYSDDLDDFLSMKKIKAQSTSSLHGHTSKNSSQTVGSHDIT